MRVTGHIAVGAASYLLAATLLPEHTIVNSGVVFWYVGLFLTLLGACLPDIDHPESTIGQKVKIISYPLSLFFGHRGITHSLIAVAAMLYCGYYFTTNYINTQMMFVPCVALGYLSHLFADSLTPQGIRPFYPMKKRFCIPIIQNGVIEVVVYVLLLSGAIWFYFNTPEHLGTAQSPSFGFR